MINWLAQQLSKSLRRRLSEPKLKKAFAVLPDVRPFKSRGAEDQSAVRVCAVQAEVKVYGSLEKMVADIDCFFSDAQGHQTELICFPEFFGMLLFGLLPSVRIGLWLLGRKRKQSSSQEAKIKSSRKNKEKAQTLRERANPRQISPPLPKLLQSFDFLQVRYTELMACFAKRYGMYVSCGTLLAPERGQVYNRHIFLGPDGSVLGVQDKLHLTETERELGISTGDELSVVPTPIGNIALMVCMDASYFETFRIAMHLGAHYAIVPIGDMAEFQPWLALRGAQVRVSETGVAAIKSALVSKPSFPMVFTGRAGIWFPLESGNPSAEASQHDAPTAVYARIDLVVQRKNDLLGCRTNPAFDRRYAEELVKKSKDLTKQVKRD